MKFCMRVRSLTSSLDQLYPARPTFALKSVFHLISPVLQFRHLSPIPRMTPYTRTQSQELQKTNGPAFSTLAAATLYVGSPNGEQRLLSMNWDTPFWSCEYLPKTMKNVEKLISICFVIGTHTEASKQDVEALVKYVCSTLAIDSDYFIPFTAVPENGREIRGIDNRSELAHRFLSVNVPGLMGRCSKQEGQQKLRHSAHSRCLPLSPNHGLFGNTDCTRTSKSVSRRCSIVAQPKPGEKTCVSLVLSSVGLGALG
jgi:hypothetical protein